MAISNEWLDQQVQNHNVVIVRFAGYVTLLDARGVLYFPGEDVMVVSDLHLEKGSYLQRYANPLPQLDTTSTLSRLHALLVDYKPQQVICLGDSFHDAQGFHRMANKDKHLLNQMVDSTPDWCWILGNHDPAIPSEAGGNSKSHLVWPNLSFYHEPDFTDPICQLIGHYHPKASVVIQKRRFSGKCFALNDSFLLMPSFGQYTGGLDINDEAIATWLPVASRRCFLLYDGAIYPA